MRRVQLFEILDQPWCPRVVRDGATDYLEKITSSIDLYRPVREQIFGAIRASGVGRIVDLCCGGGGPWLSWQWRSRLGGQLQVMLTDKFPSRALSMRLRNDSCLIHITAPIDATRVPDDLRGFRTIFSSFHHFPDRQAIAILADAVHGRDGIATAEVTSRRMRALWAMFTVPLLALLLGPGVRPFRWSRAALTYLIPVLPFVLLWDGLVSCLRSRTPRELLALTESFSEYEWTSGYAGGPGAWLPPVYLIGLPRKKGS